MFWNYKREKINLWTFNSALPTAIFGSLRVSGGCCFQNWGGHFSTFEIFTFDCGFSKWFWWADFRNTKIFDFGPFLLVWLKFNFLGIHAVRKMNPRFPKISQWQTNEKIWKWMESYKNYFLFNICSRSLMQIFHLKILSPIFRVPL